MPDSAAVNQVGEGQSLHTLCVFSFTVLLWGGQAGLDVPMNFLPLLPLPGFYGADCSLSLNPVDGKPELLAGLGYTPRKKRPHIYIYELPPK